jgi:hypothetical protein
MSDFTNLATAVSGAPQRQQLTLSSDSVWGIANACMFLQGLKMWYDYPQAIMRNAEIPARPSDIADWDYTTKDKTWALSTLEMSAWSFASTISLLSFGTGFSLWYLNMVLDNEGGDVHRLFYRSVQYQSVVTPFFMVAAAGRLFTAHNAGPSTSSYEKAYWQTEMDEAWGLPHYYDYTLIDPTDMFTYSPNDRDDQANYWFAIMLWLAAARGCSGDLKKHWLKFN